MTSTRKIHAYNVYFSQESSHAASAKQTRNRRGRDEETRLFHKDSVDEIQIYRLGCICATTAVLTFFQRISDGAPNLPEMFRGGVPGKRQGSKTKNTERANCGVSLLWSLNVYIDFHIFYPSYTMFPFPDFGSVLNPMLETFLCTFML